MGSSRPPRRGPWLPEEDFALMGLVQHQGPNNWVRISQHLRNRSPKQCRERYHQSLKSSLHHGPISPQEGELIEKLVGELGKRWAEIARRLGNRSDNAVKNWWNGSVNRRKRRAPPRDLPNTDDGVGYSNPAVEQSLQQPPNIESQRMALSTLSPAYRSSIQPRNPRTHQHCWLMDSPVTAQPSLDIKGCTERQEALSTSRVQQYSSQPCVGSNESSVRLPWIFDQRRDERTSQAREHSSSHLLNQKRSSPMPAVPSLYSDDSSNQSLSPRTTSSADSQDSGEYMVHISNDARSNTMMQRPLQGHRALAPQSKCDSLPPSKVLVGSKHAFSATSRSPCHATVSSHIGRDTRMLMSSLIH